MFIVLVKAHLKFQFLRRRVDPFSEDHGLVFRSFLHLFQQLRDKTDVHFVLKASFLEIYNEKVSNMIYSDTDSKEDGT